MLSKIRYRLCYNYTGKLNRDGRSRIALECRQGNTKIYLSSKVLVYPDQWERGRVVNHPNSQKLTVWLVKWMHGIEEIELDALLGGRQMSVGQLRTAYRENVRASATVGEFTSAVIDASDRKPQTKYAYATMVAAIEQFDGRVRLSDITHDWIERWRAHMRRQGLSDNTIKGRLKQLHCLTQEAIKRDLLPSDPFPLITIGNMSPKKEFLTMAEVRRLERVPLEGREAAVRDLFLLSCYTGLRWGDLTTLDEATVEKGVLRKRMHKTMLDVTIPVGTLFWGKGQQILDRYQPVTRLSRCVKCNSTANRIIKDVAARAGIKKAVHFHLARKSCSSLLYQLGLPMQDISMILGHAKIETTQKYYIFGREKSLIKSSKSLFKKAADPPSSPDALGE